MSNILRNSWSSTELYESYKQASPIGQILSADHESMPRHSFINSTSGVQGSKPDVYGKLRNIHTKEHISPKDIDGASPAREKFFNKISFGLLTKDATGEVMKKKIRKYHNPLDPRYIVSTESGRKQVIGGIDKGRPKEWGATMPRL